MNEWIARLKESSLKEFNDLSGMFENWKKIFVPLYALENEDCIMAILKESLTI